MSRLLKEAIAQNFIHDTFLKWGIVFYKHIKFMNEISCNVLINTVQLNVILVFVKYLPTILFYA